MTSSPTFVSARNKSYVSISRQGSLVLSDSWDSRFTGQILVGNPSRDFPIGLVDFGILHGEEPEVSGPPSQKKGAGTIYIHGCLLKCTTCYQPEFFAQRAEIYTDPQSVAKLLLEFQHSGVHSINFVVSSYNPWVLKAIKLSRAMGLSIPVVYKFSGAMSVFEAKNLISHVQLFSADFKGITEGGLAAHGLNREYETRTSEVLRYLLKNDQTVMIRYLIVPTLTKHWREVDEIIRSLQLYRYKKSKLSILTQYWNPSTRTIVGAPLSEIEEIRAICKFYDVATLYQKDGIYVG